MVCLSARLALDLSVSWRRCVSVRVVAVMRPEGVCRLHALSPHFLAFFFLPLNSSFWEKKKCEVTKSTDERALEPAGVPLFFLSFLLSASPAMCVCFCLCLPAAIFPLQ